MSKHTFAYVYESQRTATLKHRKTFVNTLTTPTCNKHFFKSVYPADIYLIIWSILPMIHLPKGPISANILSFTVNIYFFTSFLLNHLVP